MENVEAHTMRVLGTVPATTMKSSSVHFFADDVLYGRLRPYLNKVVRPDYEGLCSAEFIVFPSTNEIDNGFLQYRLNAADFVSFATHLNEGDRPRVDFSQIGGFEVWLPPLAEQCRIVPKLEELLSDLDAGVAALERVTVNLKRYRASVLKAAVEGKLTEEWRRENPPKETAKELLERILKERRRRWEEQQLAAYEAKGKKLPKGWQGKYKEPVAPQTESLPELLHGRCWATVEQLTRADRTIAYGVLQPGPDIEGGIPLVRVCDVVDGRVAIQQLKRIAPDISSRYQRTLLEGGEVLLTIVGTIGRSAVAPPSLRGANTARAVAVLPTSSLVAPQYVETALRESGMRARLTEAAHEVARKTLNLEDVRAACLPLCPIEEQDQIVAAVDERLSFADAAESLIEANLRRSGRLRQSILKRAFEGKLVPQDPKDEPAEKLLDRIKATMPVKHPSSKRPGRRKKRTV
ncbi:hypothetical protein ACFL5Q_06230 [Planctomycetota bacterium]